MDDESILKELSELVKETYLLWEEAWVGFSWKNYYFNHVQRVRALSLEIGRREAADLRKLEYAALLHDITKRYDGNILTDKQGKRILDESGFWRNELLIPKRDNLVTKLFKESSQYHELHNVSGAFIAKKILDIFGFSQDFCTSVGFIIEGHLKPDIIKAESPPNLLERKILYEADTIDANLGLTAFYRNIQIYTHSAVAEKGAVDLLQYISRINKWVNTKRPFIDRMMTQTGTQIARERYWRMREISLHITKDLQNIFSQSLEYGILGLIKYFMECNQSPNLQDEMVYLFTVWIPKNEKMLKETNLKEQPVFKRAVNFCELLSREIEGKA